MGWWDDLWESHEGRGWLESPDAPKVEYTPPGPSWQEVMMDPVAGQESAVEQEAAARKAYADKVAAQKRLALDPDIAEALGFNILGGDRPKYADPDLKRVKAEQARRAAQFDPTDDRGALADYLSDLAAQADANAASAGGSIGPSNAAAYQSAIDDALALIGDIQANSGELGVLYDQYRDIITPYAEEQLASAERISEETLPMVGASFDERNTGINASYDQALTIVQEVSELIGAGEHATAAAAAEVTGRNMELAFSAAEESELAAMIELEEIVFEKQAISDRKRDEGTSDRELALLQLEMDLREQDATERLEAARQAAAQAAASRRAAISARNAAIADARSLAQPDQIDAGQYSALTYMKKYGTEIRPDRLEFLAGKAWNAIEVGVPADSGELGFYFANQGLSKDDIHFIAGVVDAYEDGSQAFWTAAGHGDTPSNAAVKAVKGVPAILDQGGPQ